MSHIESNCGEFATIKPIEFERFRNEAGSNYFVLSPQRWIEATQAVGITSKSGRYGGTNWTSQIVISSMNGGCAIAYPPYPFHAYNPRRVDKRSASANRLAA